MTENLWDIDPIAAEIADADRPVQRSVPSLSAHETKLRDWFAGQALAGMMAFPDGYNGNFHNNCSDVGSYAYKMADAMIAARKGGGSNG